MGHNTSIHHRYIIATLMWKTMDKWKKDLGGVQILARCETNGGKRSPPPSMSIDYRGPSPRDRYGPQKPRKHPPGNSSSMYSLTPCDTFRSQVTDNLFPGAQYSYVNTSPLYKSGTSPVICFCLNTYARDHTPDEIIIFAIMWQSYSSGPVIVNLRDSSPPVFHPSTCHILGFPGPRGVRFLT